MDRRSFLKGAGFASVSIGVLSGVISLGGSMVSFSDSIDIKLYQTEEVSSYLKDKDLGANWWIDSLEYLLPKTYKTTFQDLEVNVEVGALDITMNEPDDIVSSQYRFKEVAKWGMKAEKSDDISPVKHSNLLIRSFSSDNSNYNYGGFGVSSFLPTCCQLYNGYSSVWIDPETTEIDTLRKLVAHESGHNLGLFHKHGCNLNYPEEGKSLMLSGEFARNNEENAFGEEVVDHGEWLPRFNPELEIKHLRI